MDELNPELIVNSTGSKPLLPPIAGLSDYIDKEGTKVKSTFGFMSNIKSFDKDCTGKKVVVVGGGAVGLDVVEFFAERGADVSVIEMMPVIGKDLDTNTKLDIYTIMREKNVNQLVNTALQTVNNDFFTVKNSEGEIVDINFDYGFVCLGMRSEVSELDLFKEYSEEKAIEILNLGGSTKVRRIVDGVKEGRNIVKTLEVMGAFK